MDPFGLTLLGTAAAGLGQAVANTIPSEQDKHNRKRVKQLQGLEEKGALGLSDEERAALQRAAVDPAKAEINETRRRAEAIAAAGGATSGGALAELRRDAMQTGADISSRVALDVEQADMQRERQQGAELEQRLAAQAARRSEVSDTLFGTLAGAAGLAGEAAGGPPSVQLMGLFGTKVKDFGKFEKVLAEKGLTTEQIQHLIGMEKKEPGSVARKLREAQEVGGVGTTDDLLRQVIAATAGGATDRGGSAVLRRALEAELLKPDTTDEDRLLIEQEIRRLNERVQ